MDRIGAFLRPEKSCVPDSVGRRRDLASELEISGPNLNTLKNSHLGQLVVTVLVLDWQLKEFRAVPSGSFRPNVLPERSCVVES